MGVGDFLKRHWAIIVAIVAVLLLLGQCSGLLSPSRMLASSANKMAYDRAGYSAGAGYADGMAAPSMAGASRSYTYQQAIEDFAPDVKDRKIEKTSTLASKVGRGAFDEADRRLHSIVEGAAGFILNQNVQETRGAKHGSYSLKVPSSSYEGVVAQLKGLGEVLSFTENARDVTGTIVNQDVELAVERERLTRLNKLYFERSTLDEKLRLEMAIYDQERKIKYLEDSLTRLDQNVVYSSLSVSLNEEEAALGGIEFLGLRDLAVTFTTSLQWLLYFLAAVLPWAVAIILLALLIDWARSKRRKSGQPKAEIRE